MMYKLLTIVFLFTLLQSNVIALSQENGYQTHTIRLIGPAEMSDYKEVIDDIRSNISHPISCTVEVDDRVIQIMSRQEMLWIGILQSLNTQGRFVALLTPLFSEGVKISHPYTLEKVRNRWAEFRGIALENVLFVTSQEWSSMTIRARAELENEYDIIVE